MAFDPLQVSWVRNSDSHILFIGRHRFVHEDRYELVSSPGHGRWTLKLKYVTARDAGRFECQVSTQPKISKTFSLNVVGKELTPSETVKQLSPVTVLKVQGP